jgi:SAM-dependent methyltransferase
VSEFDRYGGGEYERALERAISIGGQDASFYNEVKAKRLVELTRRRVGDPATLAVLDVGAGIGLVDEHLTSEFRRVVGLDVSQQMVERAAERNPEAEYVTYDGMTFPFENGSFDVVFASCVFHHVSPDERAGLAAEMARVARPGGLVTILEHNPWNPATRLVVSRCEFDEDATLLSRGESERLLAAAGLAPAEHAYILFFPFRNDFERRLARLPLGAQYYVASSR